MLNVNLKHKFPQFTLDAQFQAPAGITVLFGHSGSGKTSIINAVAGLFAPQSGCIQLQDTTLLNTADNTFLPAHQRQIGYIFQEDRLFPHLDVSANLNFSKRGGSHNNPLTFTDVVDILGIGHLLKRRVHHLSGGERQRIAIGRALLANPRLILADEPLSALDEQRKAELLPYFEKLRDELNIPMLYVSHQAHEVARLATTVVAIEQGRVTRAGSSTEVLGDPGFIPVGVAGIGAMLEATIVEHHQDDLTELLANEAPLFVPRLDQAIGQTVRVHLPAQEVLIALAKPQDISALNLLSATVADIQEHTGSGAIVALDTPAGRVLSRITQRSLQNLNLQPGRACHAIIKTVAIHP